MTSKSAPTSTSDRRGRGGFALSATLMPSITETTACATLTKLATTCLSDLNRSGVWLTKDSMASTRLGPLLKLVAALDMPTASSAVDVQLCEHHLCSKECKAFLTKVSTEVKELKQKTSDMFVGVCLDCFKASGRFEGECRFKHDR